MDVLEIKEQLKSAFKNFITNKVENEKWITIHPHGEDSDDYRRLKLEDGESPKEAIERTYGKKDNISKDYKENTSHYGKKEHQEEIISLYEGLKNPNKSEARKKEDRELLEHHLKELNKYSDTSGIHLSDEETKRENKIKEIKKELNKKQSDTKAEDKQSDTKDGKDLYSDENFKYNAKRLNEQFGEKPYSEWQKDVQTMLKKYGKTEEDWDNAIGARKDAFKQPDSKGDSKDTTDSPFGEGVEIIESDKKGYMLDSKNLKSYRKGDKFAIVDDWSHDDKDRYTVSFHDGKKTLDRKTYSTKRGMEKAIREHLQGGPNKETKALETKSNLEEKENTYKEVLQRYNENDRKRWSSGLSNEEYHKAWAEAEKAKKELTTARREYAESIMANFEKSDNTYYEDKQNARRERYEELSERASKESAQAHQAFRDKMSAIPMGQPILVGHYSEKRDRRYRERAWDTLGKAVKLSDKADYYESKANSVGKAGISADDANAIAKLAQKYKSGVTSAEKRRIIDRVIDIHKNRQMAGDTSKQTDYSNLGFQVERNTDINRLQLKFDGKPEANVRSILKSNGFRWSPREGAWQRQLGGNSEGGLNRVVEQLKNINNSLLMGLDEILQQEPITAQDSKIINCINNILDPVINNSKEQDMALIEELKKLITKVENTKGEEEMEIENEKVDKRKLIDEVGGILKGKVDDEVIRTIIGKMEKMSYDDSEASADNKKVKNEADEEDKKVDNEEDEKEDKKVDNEDEEDEEKVEELKKEEKKDVDNKCKNSKEENYFDKLNKIYNSAKKIEEPSADYESKQARLEAGKEYFG